MIIQRTDLSSGQGMDFSSLLGGDTGNRAVDFRLGLGHEAVQSMDLFVHLVVSIAVPCLHAAVAVRRKTPSD